MSTEAWLALTGILVTVALGLFGLIVAAVGWLLSRLINGMSDKVECLEDETGDTKLRLTVIETVLEERGFCRPSGGHHKTRNSEGPQP